MANPAIERMSGKFGYVIVVNSRDIPEKVHFTSWSAKIKRTFDDVTSSLCYDPDTATTYTASVPVTMSMTVDVAGRFRRCETSRGVVDLMFNGSRHPFVTQLGFTPLDPYMEFHGFMENLEATCPAEDVVGFTCTMRSFGYIQDLTMISCGEMPRPVRNYPGYPEPAGPPPPDYPSPGTP